MKVLIKDMQDDSSQLHGATIHDEKELYVLIETVRNRRPFVCELIGENDYKLTLGIGKCVGFAQYSSVNGSAPYHLAVASQNYTEQEYLDYFVGDTPTEIPQRYCLPFQAVKEIAAYFIQYGERSPAYSWETI